MWVEERCVTCRPSAWPHRLASHGWGSRLPAGSWVRAEPQHTGRASATWTPALTQDAEGNSTAIMLVLLHMGIHVLLQICLSQHTDNTLPSGSIIPITWVRDSRSSKFRTPDSQDSSRAIWDCYITVKINLKKRFIKKPRTLIRMKGDGRRHLRSQILQLCLNLHVYDL